MRHMRRYNYYRKESVGIIIINYFSIQVDDAIEVPGDENKKQQKPFKGVQSHLGTLMVSSSSSFL